MKKQLVLSFLFAVTAIFAAQAQSLSYSGTPSANDAVQQVRQAAEKHFGTFNSRDYDRDHCDCHKCQKQKKSKKHDDCKGKGNHYGKHKNNHGKHSCCCERNNCESRKNRDCDDDDRRDDRNGRNGRDNDDRRYSSGQRDRDDEYRTQPQPTQRKPTSTAKVKTRPTPTAKPAPSQSGAKKKETPRPAQAKTTGTASKQKAASRKS